MPCHVQPHRGRASRGSCARFDCNILTAHFCKVGHFIGHCIALDVPDMQRRHGGGSAVSQWETGLEDRNGVYSLLSSRIIHHNHIWYLFLCTWYAIYTTARMERHVHVRRDEY